MSGSASTPANGKAANPATGYAAQLASQQAATADQANSDDAQETPDGDAKAVAADKSAPADPLKDVGALTAGSTDPKANPALALPTTTAAAAAANGQAAGAQAATTATPAAVSTVIQQVTAHVAKAAVDGVDHIKVQLNPPELGHVEVRMEVGPSGHFSAVFAADRPQTVNMLQRHAHELTRSLQDAGVRTDAGSLSFNLRGQNQQNNTPWFGGFAASHAITPSWSGSMPDGTPAAAPVYASSSVGTNRVDIRV